MTSYIIDTRGVHVLVCVRACMMFWFGGRYELLRSCKHGWLSSLHVCQSVSSSVLHSAFSYGRSFTVHDVHVHCINWCREVDCVCCNQTPKVVYWAPLYFRFRFNIIFKGRVFATPIIRLSRWHNVHRRLVLCCTVYLYALCVYVCVSVCARCNFLW